MERMLLRPSEAAEMLGISRSKLYAMIASHELPVIRIGGATRVPVTDLHEWLAARRQAAEPGGPRAGVGDV